MPEDPQYFAPLAAWSWKGRVYETDEDGLPYHFYDCPFEQTLEDKDCECGATRLAEWIVANVDS